MDTKDKLVMTLTLDEAKKKFGVPSQEETLKSIDSEICKAREHLCDLIDKKREIAEEEKKNERQKKMCKEFDEWSEKLFCFFSSLVNAGFSDKKAIRLLQQIVANGKDT